ncbi:UDP-N-acetylmuramoylalanine--D-glutamate ligase [Elusimicrobium simillimum]|uniref:UDP-N-acetylmuramoyl-L-alanine--D-glutamate ligase n=1 Tax=Elusimicrobium simillimum TaxID=3143438 RepID=UPI003C6F87BF
MFKASNFKGKKACVLGFGKTGAAAAKLLAAKNFKVLVSDARDLGGKKINLGKNITVEHGGHTDKIYDCAFIVKSPGIPHSTPVLKKAKKLKIPVFSELEVSMSFLPKNVKVFTITGTNGKTTTTMLTAAILKQHCKDTKNTQRVYTVGNIGDPLANYALKVTPGDYIVIEVSSYQLEDSTYFKPNAAAMLNATPDHIDHHGSFDTYVKAKKKIFDFQDENDIAVTNGSDENCLKSVKNIKSKLFCFATTPLHKVRAHVFYDGDEIIFSSGVHLRPPKLIGIHNIENAMAASLMALGMGVSELSVQKAFNSFKSVEHRIEHFYTAKGIKCINDSKATNVESTMIALKALEGDKNIFLILGGQDKQMPYTPLLPFIEKQCKQVLTIGAAAPLISRDLKEFKNIKSCKVLDTAVEYAFKHGKKGDVLLLSPACASFDQFKNFEDRGKYFKKICKSLAK